MHLRSILPFVISALFPLIAQERPLTLREVVSQDAEGIQYAVAPATGDQAAVSMSGGRWTLTVRVASPHASGLQLLLDELRLPAGAQLTLATSNGETIARYSGVGPLQGDAFWTAAVPGPEAILRVEFLGQSVSSLPFQVRQLRHIYAAAVNPDMPPEPPAPEAPAQEAEAARFTRFRGVLVPYTVRHGLAVLEGDIVLGTASEMQTVSTKEAAGQRASQGISGDYYRWAGGVVPYEIDPALPNQGRIASAIAHWNAKLNGVILLRPRGGETDYIRFVNSNSPDTCTSYMGNVHIPGQAVTIGANCTAGNVIHEIGHAVGLFHEHTREDRDRFIRINTANILPGSVSNFEQAISTSDDIGAYDYGSIMHYGAFAFSGNGQPTVETIPAGIPIGQRDGLSAGDIAGVKSMYASTAPQPTATVAVTIASVPAGQTVIIDGTSAITPATHQWIAGSAHTISAVDTISSSTRQTFRGWSDGGAQTHTVTIPASATTITANFQKQYMVTAGSSNSGLGTVLRIPASADSFYDAGTTLQVLASPKGTACLASWAGVTAPPGTPVQVTVDQPYRITGNFQSGSITATLSHLESSRNGGSGTVAVAASSGCTWTAKASANWITIHSGSAGTASGTIEFSLERKTGTAVRTGFIAVGDVEVLIQQ